MYKIYNLKYSNLICHVGKMWVKFKYEKLYIFNQKRFRKLKQCLGVMQKV